MPFPRCDNEAYRSGSWDRGGEGENDENGEEGEGWGGAAQSERHPACLVSKLTQCVALLRMHKAVYLFTYLKFYLFIFREGEGGR